MALDRRAFAATRFHFTSGVRAGEPVTVHDGEGQPLLTYRSFASVLGIVATMMALIVFMAGLAAALFLVAEQRPAAAAGTIALALLFCALIGALVPRVNVTLYEGSSPALSIEQRSLFPLRRAAYEVSADGQSIALLRRGLFYRLGRNRWSVIIPPDSRPVAHAVEESFGRAMVRKIGGKFQRRFQSNLALLHEGAPIGMIIRRPDEKGHFDLLEISPAATLDRRIPVALATLVLGSEP